MAPRRRVIPPSCGKPKSWKKVDNNHSDSINGRSAAKKEVKLYTSLSIMGKFSPKIVLALVKQTFCVICVILKKNPFKQIWIDFQKDKANLPKSGSAQWGKEEGKVKWIFLHYFLSSIFCKILSPQVSSFFSEFFQGQRQVGRNCLVIQGKRLLLHSTAAAIDNWYTAACSYSAGNALFTHY